MNSHLWNIVLSYCSERNETIELIKLIDDDSKITELHYGGDIGDLSRFKNLRILVSDTKLTNLDALRGMPPKSLVYRGRCYTSEELGELLGASKN